MGDSKCYCCRQSFTTRRDFLRAGTLSFLGIGLSDFLRVGNAYAAAGAATPAKAQSVIMLWLEGGISQLDTWDVKANGGFKAISTNASGVQISELLPRVSKH